MIRSFRHKGLKKFYETGSTAGIQTGHAKRLRLILGALNAATEIRDMHFPGSGLHQLKGKSKELWALTVSGNWRITFKFENGDSELVDYLDYH